MPMNRIILTSFADARDAFRHRDLRQSLYDAGHRLMTGVIVNLHGDAHIARRRLENRLFRRDTFAWYERERIPAIVDDVLAPAISAGRGELLGLARRTMTTLSVDVAGVDVPGLAGRGADPAVVEAFHTSMDHLARASTVAHAVGDTAAIIARGDTALERFREEWYLPSLRRRQQLIERHRLGEIDEGDLPRDVLTTLLRNVDDLAISDDELLREIAYFPWVGSHSTSGQFVHAMHHVFASIGGTPDLRQRLIDDDALRQRYVHESMRLHPASPVALRTATAGIELRSGRRIPSGAEVTIDVERANRDPDVFGPDADQFDPDRTVAPDVHRFGLSFGHGAHSCLGRELAGGLENVEGGLLGAVAVMIGAVLRAGAHPHPTDPPSADTTTTRTVWGRYPVRFDPSGTVRP